MSNIIRVTRQLENQGKSRPELAINDFRYHSFSFPGHNLLSWQAIRKPVENSGL
jgi:hypothetical protein